MTAYVIRECDRRPLPASYRDEPRHLGWRGARSSGRALACTPTPWHQVVGVVRRRACGGTAGSRPRAARPITRGSGSWRSGWTGRRGRARSRGPARRFPLSGPVVGQRTRVLTTALAANWSATPPTPQRRPARAAAPDSRPPPASFHRRPPRRHHQHPPGHRGCGAARRRARRRRTCPARHRPEPAPPPQHQSPAGIREVTPQHPDLDCRSRPGRLRPGRLTKANPPAPTP
jgi:hypothetical protein